jgi:hypothetical protein
MVRSEARFIGAIPGHGRLASKDHPMSWERVFPCHTQSLSTRAVVITSNVRANTGQMVQLRLDVVGTLNGLISHKLSNGFAIRLDLKSAERDLLQRRIDWLKKKYCLGLGEQRAAQRVAAGNPRTVVIFADGTIHPCSIVDQSTSGVAVSAAIVPPIGTPLAIGCLLGRVARHFAGGFAIQFLEACTSAELSHRLRPTADATP